MSRSSISTRTAHLQERADQKAEQRLIEILEDEERSSVADLLQVEKELGRVREEIEKMQGELKYMDALVQFATVTITLA